ncbi:MAG TPA: cupin domain-containing protein [Anaerolineae bacterium]|nr:cupin domain-containing protein [Anaerolineae bacterium]
MPRVIAKAQDVPFIVLNERAQRKVYMGTNCSITYNVVKPGPYNPSHKHEIETQYVFVLYGIMRFVVDGEEVIAEKGDMVVFEPGQAHGGHVIGEEEAASLDIFVPVLPDHEATAVKIGKKADE